MSELTSGFQGPGPSVFGKASLSRSDILALDRLAAAAWAAPEQEFHGGWIFRHADGITRRANSAAPFPLEDGATAETQIAYAEAFYPARGLPPRVQISPAAEPDGIDELLAARGYEIESGVEIMIADASRLAAESPGNILIAETAPGGWWDCYMEGYGRDPRRIVAGARETPLFAAVPDDTGTMDAIGLGVMGGGWLAVFGMYTRPERRRLGLGAGLIRALAAFAVDRGVHGAYLQVEDDNPAARRLYEKLGFRGVYGYHYRTLWTAT
ncbi:MAG: GNAT family N-acetyltransferase [Rhodospirillales bacterium]|nr:GNAT family N-acetyltransferase [Rhodospirillales bacterium]MBO6787989.1 GNAT family N-acetyltransferase [Rhodospirillales bacterium]